MKERKISIYLLVVFTVSSFILRLIPWKYTIIDGGKWVLFVQPDAYYHLRRAAIWAYNFPNIITMDYYMSYPFGAECPWPPLYDWLIAVISLILGLGQFKIELIQLTTALLPPIIAALCVIPTYLTVKMLWNNERVALMASFFAIIMPGMLGYSTIASGDHHIAETLIGLCFYYYALKIIKNGEKKVQNKRYITLTGLFIAIGLLVWQGEIVFYTIFAFYLIVLFIYRRNDSEYILSIAKSFLYTAILGSSIVAFVRFLIPRATELSLFDFGYFSYFQPAYVVFIYSIAYIICKLVLLHRNDKSAFKKVIMLISIVVILVVVLIKPLRDGIWQGINFLFKTDPWHSSINEFQTTFSLKMITNFESLEGVINFVYFLTFLLPLAYGLKFLFDWFFKKNNVLGPFEIRLSALDKKKFFTKQNFKYENANITRAIEKKNKSTTLFFIVTGIVFFLLAFYQKRWTNSYSPILAIGIALLCNSIYEKIKSGHSLFREFLHWRAKKKKEKIGYIKKFLFLWEKSPIVMTGLAIIIVLLPYFMIAESILLREGYPIPSDLYNTLQWMKRFTPATSHLLKPNEEPEYGVLSVWDHGHFIQYIAERPTIVNNFGHQLPGDGFKTAVYVWGVETEEELKAVLDKYKVRYLLLNDPIPFFSHKSDAYTWEGFFDSNFDLIPTHFGVKVSAPKDEFFKKPLANIWIFDGNSNAFRSASRNFRLVFESENPNWNQYFEDIEIKQYKLFEYVKGVKIKGKAKPRDIIYIKAEFVTNFDRMFLWQAAAIANNNGDFVANLPYATSEDNLFVKPLSPYYFYTSDKMQRLYVSNYDVENGNEMEVDLTRGENIPDFVKEEIKTVISNLVGKVKDKKYIMLHRKPNE